MNITILASGSQNLILDDSYGTIPWSHLTAYRKFLLERIKDKTVLIGGKTFQLPFFQDLIMEALAYPIILSRDSRFSLSHSKVTNIESALRFAKINKAEELFVLGGAYTFEKALPFANKVEYLQVDMEARGLAHFPSELKKNFKRVSIEPMREEGIDKKVTRFTLEKWLKCKTEPSSVI